MTWPNLAETASEAKVYQQSSWVYLAVNRIAEAAALVPLHVLRLDGEQRMEVEHHPLEILLDAPNPYISRFELFEQTVGMLELTGNAYWFLAGDSAGVPSEIWPLRPDRVSIFPDPERYIKGYVYEIDGRRIPLLPSEVVHFKRWHPSNDYYGLSALEAARLAVTSDRSMAEWNHNTFSKDNGIPAGIVTIKNQMTDADYERIKREWRQTYGGPQRRTAFLRGDTVSWQNIGLNHNELDFLKGRQAHRDEILNIFGIPVGLVSENATEANAKVAERLFIERTLWPKLVRIAQKITQEMLPFWPGMHVAEFEDIRPTDTQARLDEIKTAYPVLSINEIRQRYYHLPPVEWGALPVGNNIPVGAGHAMPLPTANDSSIAESAAATPSGNGGNKALNGQKSENGGEVDIPIQAWALEPDSLGERARQAELTQWERFAVKRLGKAKPRSFEVRSLPDEIAFEISARLLAAENENDVKAVFAGARAELAG
jgi:HK97 family phage portal protein